MTVQQVDLYLATGGCKPDPAGFDCEGIVPPNADLDSSRDRVDGEVYFVDDNRPFVSTPDEDGSAWFHLDPSAQLEIKAAIAVGKDPAAGETGVAIFQKIDLDVTQHVRIDLESIASREVRGLEQPAVEVWRPTSDDYRCVAAEVQNRVVYIVPRNDPDCDQVGLEGGQECLPGVHEGQQSLSSELLDQTCATTQATGLCVLGSEGCDERTMSDATGCTASTAKKYCTPDRVCANCPDNLAGDCFEGLFGMSSRIDCIVEVEPDPKGGPGTQSCPDRAVPPALVNNVPCRQAEIAIATDGIQGFASGVMSPILGSQVGATLKPALEDGTCRVGLEPLDAKFPTESSRQTIHSLVKLDVTPPGSPAERFLILPLKVVFIPVTDCLTAAGTGCSLTTAPDDHFQQCFQ